MADLKWDMKERSEKLDELRKKYPEIIDNAVKIAGLYIKINTIWTNDEDIDEAFTELEEILSDMKDKDKENGESENGLTKFDQFVKDMEKVGIKHEEYHGRFFYHGPAVRTNENGFPKRDDVIRATRVKLQWDQLGLDYIVYPE